VQLLEHEIARLNADVHAAEQALVAVESGLRGPQTRTQAVSMLAEARIEVDRAARRAPWRADDTAEARAKLAEAERQLAADHFGSAIFFVSRASRIASTLLAEADRVEATPDVRYLRGDRVNLRAAPALDGAVLAVLRGGAPLFPEGRDGDWMLVRTGAGRVGWVHESLVEAR